MDKQPLERYFELCDHSETYNARLVNIMGRITNGWIEFRNYILTPPSNPDEFDPATYEVELRKKIKAIDGLITELNESFELIIINKTQIIGQVSAIAAWVQKNFTPKVE